MPDLRKLIEGYESVWAIWHTATTADGLDIWQLGRVKKLVLIDPYSDYLGMQALRFNRSAEELAPAIKATTRRAREQGVNVKWFSGPIPSAITIGNPESNPVIWVEPLILYTSTDDRCSFRVDSRHPEALAVLRTQFDEVWRNSVESYDL